MKVKCENCNSPIETSVKKYLTSLTNLRLCEDCEKIQLPKPKLNWDDLDVESNFDGDIPDEIKEKVLDELESHGIDPADAKLIAIRGSASGLDGLAGLEDVPDEVLKKMRILKARHDFLTCAKSFMSTLHDLNHADVPKDELEVLIRRFTSIEYEIVTDYLFYGEDDLPNQEDLVDRGMRSVFECESDR